MMRTLLFALALVGCSYDWNSLQAVDDGHDASTDGIVSFDPRHTIVPGAQCNPVSMEGCGGSMPCLGMIGSDQSITELTCGGPLGSGSQGSFCDGPDNCVPGFLCWTNPSDATDTHCEEPCFDDRDCTSGHCDTTGPYAAPYSRATLYRCL